jgi:16S rRNA (cytosine1402-N4)-methyltransferase
MQLDQAERGFSFMRDGPLDMRMSQSGPSAADLVNGLPEADIANLLYLYGEERASRRIAKSIVQRRSDAVFETTLDLAQLIEKALPRSKPGQSHAATRSFQALRIAVNNEYGELFAGLLAGERALRAGGLFCVVSFHSIEDRMVKRFFQMRAGRAGSNNRYAPHTAPLPTQFELVSRKPILGTPEEIAQNPRARSAKLRIARRTASAAGGVVTPSDLGMPLMDLPL